MESYAKSSTRIEKTEEKSGCPHSPRKSDNRMEASIISESSDSEEEKKGVRRCLRLNQYSNRAEIEEDEKKRAIVSQTDCYARSDSEYFPSNSAALSDENKGMLNDDADVILKSLENKRLPTLKKHNDVTSNKREGNALISDSDTDSSSSKYNDKRLPRKQWAGPDIRLNLKDLGLNKQLGSWVELIQQKPAMSIIPVSFILHKLIFCSRM